MTAERVHGVLAMTMTARQIYAAIKDNVAAMCADDIDHDRFDAEQRRLWDLAASSPRKLAAVTTMVRNGLYDYVPEAE